MVSKRKKSYMRNYNQRDYVKSRKAAYMRKVRAEETKLKHVQAVHAFIDAGFEEQAFQYALEFAPDMLLTIKSQNGRSRANTK